MEKILTLRKEPIFKIIIRDEEFEIFDNLNSTQNKTYSFNQIVKSSFHRERINWIGTILSFILNFSTNNGLIERNDNEIRFFHDEIPIRIFLKECDMNIAESVFEIIKSKSI